MSPTVCNYGESQINFFMSKTPSIARNEQAGNKTAPKVAKNGPQILTFALQRRPRATRASVPKVRTGCITCERRHVKCDETKPSCLRCIKCSGSCEGYETSPGSSSGSSTSTPSPEADAGIKWTANKAMVKKRRPPMEPRVLPRPSLNKSDGLSVLLEPTMAFFKDENERYYFDHWLKYRNRMGGGFFDERLWNETIPQLSRQNTSVRYAIMAIAGISQAIKNSLKPTNPAIMGANGPHYTNAMTYYGRAIREIRGANLDIGSLRGAIVCCLLFVCFEVLHGDRKAAFSHINSGQQMMDELLSRSEQEEFQGQNAIGSPAVETDILHVFQRLIQQSWSCGVLRKREPYASGRLVKSEFDDDDAQQQPTRAWCCEGGTGKQCTIHKMPPTFQDLHEARRWFDVTQHYVTHSSNIVFMFTHKGLGEDFLSECNERVQKHLVDIEKARAGVKPATSEQWQGFKDALERWHRGFESLWIAAQKNRYSDEKSFAQAAHLRTHYLAMYGCVCSPLSSSYDAVVALTPTYREIVELCDGLLQYQQRSFQTLEMFTMDMGPTWPLFMAGLRCRDPSVRNDAIQLLRQYPRRDGLWDSRIFYAITVRNQMLEVSNAREGTVEEQWWRLQHRSAFVDEQGHLVARAMDKNPSTGTWDFGEDSLCRFLFD
ncbi:Transcriptional regulatory protein moc3 [Colletotrichum orbiculare MAFF 240422]|uniref:Transcriptional regulatory protein moc3 n=1 Tax=Colletotrichum orbiculare (strain 104-T / ATCC 96160 / CBS 514.97 / LARS 414 / MAFF 240422) TaxID=1213857 RepID=A0A484FGT1_COLOR|nr:Transcriptional regulatory protein moc3 [Colletotrichum orbiculare MAFF 240422]